MKLLSSPFGKMPTNIVLGKLKLVEMQNCLFHAPVEALEELLSSCFFLENVNLKSCGMLDHLNLISSTLKNLVVHACDYIQNGEIQAPQLVFFQLIGKIVEFSTIIVSGDLDVELHLESRPYHDIDYVQLIKLKKLLGNFDQARVLTIISKQHLVCHFFGESSMLDPTASFSTAFEDKIEQVSVTSY
ncbi:hypothetical protein WN943_010866 [Citrus x changshan-huyou]